MSNTTSFLKVCVRVVIFSAFVAGIVACIYLISGSQLSGRESAMLGILVTILSILASWIITDLYATSQQESAIEEVRAEHRNNLRTYALKAAEKVNNLSSELNKLSVYLEEELECADYRSSEEELCAKEERIESAIHLIRTLKSVNDTALSDWEGVIGDELDQRREEKEEKEEEVKALIERIDALVENNKHDLIGKQEYTDLVRHEVGRLKRELQLAMFQLTDASIPRRVRKKEPKQDIIGRCPSCGFEIKYRQRPLGRSFKALPCPSCAVKLISTFSEKDGFVLKKREALPTKIVCPACFQAITAPLDTFPGSSTILTCPACMLVFRAVRTLDGQASSKDVFASKPVVKSKDDDLTDDIIERVRAALPPQPWPTGTHKHVATSLKLSFHTVTQAISELIKRGVFKHQVDGVLYAPVHDTQDENNAEKLQQPHVN